MYKHTWNQYISIMTRTFCCDYENVSIGSTTSHIIEENIYKPYAVVYNELHVICRVTNKMSVKYSKKYCSGLIPFV